MYVVEKVILTRRSKCHSIHEESLGLNDGIFRTGTTTKRREPREGGGRGRVKANSFHLSSPRKTHEYQVLFYIFTSIIGGTDSIIIPIEMPTKPENRTYYNSIKINNEIQ